MESLDTLVSKAKTIRKHIIQMSFNAKSAHMGGSLSCVELLVALYFKIMRIFSDKPDSPDRDRLIFSKAHDAKALYATLAERGFFDTSVLEGYEQNGGLLPGHCVRQCVPGIEISAGGLGHGLPIASGIAYSGKLDHKNYRVFTIISDGECDEGSIWEAALFAGQHRLDNLIAIIDYNKLQGFGFTKDILDLEPFTDKWKSFRWAVKEIDGHNFSEIIPALSTIPIELNKPSVFIAHTIKGYGGVKKYINHVASQYIPPTQEEAEEVIRKLEQS